MHQILILPGLNAENAKENSIGQSGLTTEDRKISEWLKAFGIAPNLIGSSGKNKRDGKCRLLKSDDFFKGPHQKLLPAIPWE